jgi:hypothetical protein
MGICDVAKRYHLALAANARDQNVTLRQLW